MKRKTMKAWQLPEFGLKHLERAERPLPVPGPDEVLIQVSAVSLNYRDRLVINGELLPSAPVMPFIPVSDFAGEVVALGDRATRFKPGERVMGNFWTEWIDGTPPASMADHGRSLGGPLPGALAEYIAIAEDAVIAAPETLSDVEAATLPIAALTAWFALVETGRLKPGETVVVQGTGGVALAALQLASALKAKVIVTSRSEAKLKRVHQFGAWATIDTSREPRWSQEVLHLTNGHGAQNIIELIGGENIAQSARALAMEGQISLIGFLDGFEFSMTAVPLMLRHAKLQGISVGHKRAFEDLVRFIEGAGVRPVIDTIYPFDDALAAFRQLEEGPFGKIVVQLG